jgi:hypothetical protein
MKEQPKQMLVFISRADDLKLKKLADKSDPKTSKKAIATSLLSKAIQEEVSK